MEKKPKDEESTKEKRTKRDKARLLVELEKSSGIIAFACKKAKISRMTYYRWCRDDEEFMEKAEDIQEIQVDVAEAALLKKIKAEDTTAIIFYLKTKGKSRGYSERREITGKDGGEIKVVEVDTSGLTQEQREALLYVAEQDNKNNE